MEPLNQAIEAAVASRPPPDPGSGRRGALRAVQGRPSGRRNGWEPAVARL